MSDTSGTIPTSALSTMWRCTGELRWAVDSINGRYNVVMIPTYPEGARPRLQQRWARISGLGSAFDDEEWRDVPTVEG
jgi:hypothetical protein